MRRARIPLALCMGLAAASCGGADPVPPDTFYRLSVQSPGRSLDPAVTEALKGVLMVGALDGDGLVRGRPMLYSDAAEGKSVRQHNYHLWVDSPTRLIQGQLVNFLKDSEIAHSVVTPDMRVRADFEVIGRIQRLERVFGAGGPKVVAAMDLSVVRQSDRKLILTDNYRAEVASEDDSIEASVRAMNAALEQIFATFASDLNHRSEAASTGSPIR